MTGLRVYAEDETLLPGRSTSMVVEFNITQPAEIALAAAISPSNFDLLAPVIARFDVVSRTPLLRATVSSLRADAERGGQTIVSFNTTNRGTAPTGPLTIALPPSEILTIAVPMELPSLALGETTSISLALTPPPDAPVGTLSGTLNIGYGDDQVFGLRYSFRIVSQHLADLTVVVEDEFSFFAEGKPKVAGAVVRVTNSAGFRATLTTDESGIVTFQNLREGTYRIHTQALKHSSDTTTLTLSVDTPPQRIFLFRSVVSYVWTVQPTTFEDRYEFELVAGALCGVRFLSLTLS